MIQEVSAEPPQWWTAFITDEDELPATPDEPPGDAVAPLPDVPGEPEDRK